MIRIKSIFNNLAGYMAGFFVFKVLNSVNIQPVTATDGVLWQKRVLKKQPKLLALTLHFNQRLQPFSQLLLLLFAV